MAPTWSSARWPWATAVAGFAAWLALGASCARAVPATVESKNPVSKARRATAGEMEIITKYPLGTGVEPYARALTFNSYR